MRNVIATLLQVAAVVGVLSAAFLWCLPAGLFACSVVVGAAGWLVDR